jgi:hypothetical protein
MFYSLSWENSSMVITAMFQFYLKVLFSFTYFFWRVYFYLFYQPILEMENVYAD